MTHLPLIILSALALVLGGCASRERINWGAELAIYNASPQWMFDRLPPGVDRATGVLKGYYDPANGEITISEQLCRSEWARTLIHEMGHAYDHQQPASIWALISRYDSPERASFNLHSPAETARLMAVAASFPQPDPTKAPSR